MTVPWGGNTAERSLSVPWMAEWMKKKKEMKCGTYRILFQKNEAHHDNVYITSNGPIFKEAGNLLKWIEIRERIKKIFFFFLISKTAKGRSIRHILTSMHWFAQIYLCRKYQFPSRLNFQYSHVARLLFNSCGRFPRFWADSGRRRRVLPVSITKCLAVRMYVVTLALPCFSTIFLSATTRVSRWGPSVTCQLTFWAVRAPYSSNLR